MRQLESNVDTRVRAHRLRRRFAIGTGLVAGGAVIALGLWSMIPVREVPVIVELQPIVVNRAPAPPPAPAPEPPPAPAPAPGGLVCPVLESSPEADIGAATPVDEIDVDRDRDRDEPAVLAVAVARDVPWLAILAEGVVRMSTDDGGTFRTVFRGRGIDQIAMDREGTLYARDGSALGVRMLDGTERWHTPKVAKCSEEDCNDRLALLDDELVWLHEDQVATSRDRGRSWKRIPTADQPWDFADAPVLAWRGALYQIDRYVDRCGVDDAPVWRLSPARKISHTIFHNNYHATGEPVLRTSDASATTWTWREGCGHEDYTMKVGACRTPRDADITAMLMAKTLRPVEGVRTLAVYESSLVELCEDGARQIYRRWPVDRLDAVDFRGRPLVVIEGGLYRWSTQHGWRRLYQVKPAD